MKKLNKLVIVMAGLALAPTVVHAEGEVNQRLDNQNKRINAGVANGTLSKKQAHKLKKKDRAIHKEEHTMRQGNGGKLTPGDKAVLNQQENSVSKQIYNEKH